MLQSWISVVLVPGGLSFQSPLVHHNSSSGSEKKRPITHTTARDHFPQECSSDFLSAEDEHVFGGAGSGSEDAPDDPCSSSLYCLP